MNKRDIYNNLKDDKINNIELKNFTITDKSVRAIMDGIPIGTYVRLCDGKKVLMSNTPMEYRTNTEFIINANGNVLIAGLGIGLIITEIQDQDNIKSITVIEKNKDIIDIIKRQIPFNDKVKIINADVWNWIPKNGTMYDTIYLDIWSYVNSNIYETEMIPLKNKFKKYLIDKKFNKDAFIACWAEYEAKNNRRL